MTKFPCRNFETMNFPSPLIEKAVKEFSRLPGIGKKTAIRLVLNLLNKPLEDSEDLSEAILRLRKDIRFCKQCHNVSEKDKCTVCLDKGRDHSMVCLVENLRDLISIENTGQYRGLYHVLGGVISPIDGVGPENLNFDSLMARLKTGEVTEIIVALSPNMDGDTTLFYLSKVLKSDFPKVKLSSLARGVSFGGDLEYVDEMTLARSISARIPFEQTLIQK